MRKRLLLAAILAGASLADGARGATGDGAAIWASAGCGGCHTLRAAGAAGATGTVGPDLDALRPSPGQVAEQVISGGVGMPSFSGTLSTTQIAVLARFVYDATHGTTTPALPAPLLPGPTAAGQKLQRELATLGYFSGPITGVVGPLTTAAVKRFQAAAGLAVDGKAGRATLAALAAKVAATSPPAATGALPKPTAAVKLLQQRLAALGYFAGQATGVYGPITTAAVKRFQAAAGLTVDGRWGPASQAALDRRTR